jgi:urease accessory protein
MLLRLFVLLFLGVLGGESLSCSACKGALWHTPGMTDLAVPQTTSRREWLARLRLGYRLQDERTVLARREHFGPLRVQRPFYPEGPGVCHTYILHPPAGIVAGDRLEIDLDVGSGAHAVITTPGATRWYRCGAGSAHQSTRLAAAAGACLEWLPQEQILYRGARATTRLHVDLASGARFLGWEVTCLGRTAAGERFDAGELRQQVEIYRQGVCLWQERTSLDGGSRLMTSPAGLRGCPVSGLLLAAGLDAGPALVAACRAVPVAEDALCGVTALPGVLAVRYLGHSAERVQHHFRALWALLRPSLVQRAACAPRIWAT